MLCIENYELLTVRAMLTHRGATLTQLNSHTEVQWLDETTEPPGLAHGGMHVVTLSGKPQDRPSLQLANVTWPFL